jgi:hypothetical protein
LCGFRGPVGVQLDTVFVCGAAGAELVSFDSGRGGCLFLHTAARYERPLSDGNSSCWLCRQRVRAAEPRGFSAGCAAMQARDGRAAKKLPSPFFRCAGSYRVPVGGRGTCAAARRPCRLWFLLFIRLVGFARVVFVRGSLVSRVACARRRANPPPHGDAQRAEPRLAGAVRRRRGARGAGAQRRPKGNGAKRRRPSRGARRQAGWDRSAGAALICRMPARPRAGANRDRAEGEHLV